METKWTLYEMDDLRKEVAEIKTGVALLLQDRAVSIEQRQRVSDKLEDLLVNQGVVKAELARIAPLVANFQNHMASSETTRRFVGTGALALVGAAGGAIGGFVNWFLHLPK